MAAALWANEEMECFIAELQRLHCAPDEKLAYHYTTNQSAHLIFSDASYGLRASTAGQLDGGVSLCKAMPQDLGWAPYGRDGFRHVVGAALWGEKARDVLPGNADDDKLDLCDAAHLVQLKHYVENRQAWFDRIIDCHRIPDPYDANNTAKDVAKGTVRRGMARARTRRANPRQKLRETPHARVKPLLARNLRWTVASG